MPAAVFITEHIYMWWALMMIFWVGLGLRRATTRNNADLSIPFFLSFAMIGTDFERRGRKLWGGIDKDRGPSNAPSSFCPPLLCWRKPHQGTKSVVEWRRALKNPPRNPQNHLKIRLTKGISMHSIQFGRLLLWIIPCITGIILYNVTISKQ